MATGVDKILTLTWARQRRGQLSHLKRIRYGLCPYTSQSMEQGLEIPLCTLGSLSLQRTGDLYRKPLVAPLFLGECPSSEWRVPLECCERYTREGERNTTREGLDQSVRGWSCMQAKYDACTSEKLLVPFCICNTCYHPYNGRYLGFLRTIINESPWRNIILLINLSLLMGCAFFFPLSVFGTCEDHT